MEWTWGHKVVNNSQGFREKEFLVPKPAGTFRVMVLGDSLTWGAGLSVSERYTDRLAYLIAKSDSDQAVEVLNFGMPGGPTVAEHRHLKKLQADVDPDLIIVGFCINDPQPRGENFSVERSKLHPLYEAIAKLRHLGLQKTYAFIISGIDNTLISLGMLPTWQDALNRIYQPDTFEWQAFENALAGIKEISDQRGLPQPVFITLTQGIAGGFTQHQHIEDWFSKAATAATAKGFVVVDPKPRFVREMEMSELAVNPFDGHPSAKANVIYAEALLKPVLQAVKERRSGY
jgi:lysophospholipase L1-like esterase